MLIELNGEHITTQAATLAELVTERALQAEAVATALNGAFVPRGMRAGTALEAGMKVEILTPMQGG